MATNEELLTKMNECIAELQNAEQTVVNAKVQIANAPVVAAEAKATADKASQDVTTLSGVAVKTSGNQTIAGTKTFSASPVVPAPAITDNSTKAAPTSFVVDMMRRDIEAQSGGRNTVVRDKNGNPHVMVVIPRFNLQDIDASLGTGTHPAFIVNGVTKQEILMGKYIASQGSDGLAQTLPHKAPWCRITFDAALAACRALGSNFGLVSNATWAARALYLWKEFGDHVYYGNTNWGRHHTKMNQTGVLQVTNAPGDTGMDTAGAGAATLTGSGGDAWNDDGTAFGVADMVGNVWEWNSGMRLNEGEYQIIPNNDALMANSNMAANSGTWKAILQDGSLVAPGTANTLKINAPKVVTSGNSGAPTVVTTITNKLSGSGESNGNFNAFAAASGVTIPGIMKTLGLFPVSATGVQGYQWTRNFGERLPLRGGFWDLGAHCGPFALALIYTRSASHWHFGFRVAFYS